MASSCDNKAKTSSSSSTSPLAPDTTEVGAEAFIQETTFLAKLSLEAEDSAELRLACASDLCKAPSSAT